MLSYNKNMPGWWKSIIPTQDALCTTLTYHLPDCLSKLPALFDSLDEQLVPRAPWVVKRVLNTAPNFFVETPTSTHLSNSRDNKLLTSSPGGWLKKRNRCASNSLFFAFTFIPVQIGFIAPSEYTSQKVEWKFL